MRSRQPRHCEKQLWLRTTTYTLVVWVASVKSGARVAYDDEEGLSGVQRVRLGAV